MGYKPTIGLEIHAELKTATKMFCNSKNDPDETRPNINICPVCVAHPGTLPVINKEAVRHMVRIGKAIGGTIADFTEFDRKSYFYPDIPKGYQISQYKFPIVSGGLINGVQITRVHLEEDTARSSHTEDENYSLIDFNRAGVPLMELVTEPVIHDAKTAGDFARELQLLLRYLKASEANMEKGEMRVEANISVSSEEGQFGTKVEVKNLNSFKAVEKAIDYEITRQINLLNDGQKIVQETRGWDENKQHTFSQRIKENANDYRYFPDPDLPKIQLDMMEEFGGINIEDNEIPWKIREKLTGVYGVKAEDANMYLVNPVLKDFFEKTVLSRLSSDLEAIKLASNYITSDLVGLLRGDFTLLNKIGEGFVELVLMAKNGEISSRGVKEILAVMIVDGGGPQKIAKEKGLFQKSDESELSKIVEKVIENNPTVANEVRAGKEVALQFLVGQGMKESRGSANPQVLKRIFVDMLK